MYSQEFAMRIAAGLTAVVLLAGLNAGAGSQPAGSPSAEAVHYRIVTLPMPKDLVLEVGGLAFRPDGKLLACTRRGEVWLIHNPLADPAEVTFTRFASGLHEALGLVAESKGTVYAV